MAWPSSPPSVPICWTAPAGSRVAGEPERVVRAGETCWEPGGDTIHHRDGNDRTDVRGRCAVAVVCPPDRPMLVLVDDEERPDADTSNHRLRVQQVPVGSRRSAAVFATPSAHHGVESLTPFLRQFQEEYWPRATGA